MSKRATEIRWNNINREEGFRFSKHLTSLPECESTPTYMDYTKPRRTNARKILQKEDMRYIRKVKIQVQ
jgi:hypothetical protein